MLDFAKRICPLTASEIINLVLLVKNSPRTPGCPLEGSNTILPSALHGEMSTARKLTDSDFLKISRTSFGSEDWGIFQA